MSLSRFDSHIDEPTVACESCGAQVAVGDALYDERAEHYLCDRDCFYDWCEANSERVGDYYYEMNIE